MRALGNSLEDPWLELCAFTVRSLVGELTSHKPCGAVKKKKLKEEKGSGQQPMREVCSSEKTTGWRNSPGGWRGHTEAEDGGAGDGCIWWALRRPTVNLAMMGVSVPSLSVPCSTGFPELT